MKKLFSLVLIASLLFGCTSNTVRSDVSFDTLKTGIETVVKEKRENIMVSELDVLEAFLGDEVNNVEHGVLMGGFITDATRIIIIEMKEGKSTRNVESILNEILKSDQETFSWYVPEQNTFVNDGEVIVKNQFVILVIAENHQDIIDKIETIFEKK